MDHRDYMAVRYPNLRRRDADIQEQWNKESEGSVLLVEGWDSVGGFFKAAYNAVREFPTVYREGYEKAKGLGLQGIRKEYEEAARTLQYSGPMEVELDESLNEGGVFQYRVGSG